jgi:hypothetical protein
METWNKIFEHHDDEWSQETLSMTVDQLLDRLKEMQRYEEYEAIENIIKDNIEIEDESGLPTFDELMDDDPLSDVAKRKATKELRSDIWDPKHAFDEDNRKRFLEDSDIM